jgi:acyl dehydratase
VQKNEDATSPINMNFLVGKEYEVIFTISKKLYRKFKNLSKDMNPLHTDDFFAKSKGFPSRVMYGNILNIFISYFIGECLPVKNVIIHKQDIHYKKPFYLFDIIKLNVVVHELHESVNSVVFKFKFINQHNSIIAVGNIQIGILI